MDETILFPSPNWFLVSNLAASPDGWLIYGGPSKSLCMLEPLPADSEMVTETPKYYAHVINQAHSEKIVSVDISPAWSQKRNIVTGSADGGVKQWTLEKLNHRCKAKCTHSHEIHLKESEEVIGVGYSTELVAVTVGTSGNVVKWELSSNTVRTYSNISKSFRPTCMSCSPHLPFHVAIGTKQGVVIVLDLTDAGKVLYKIRGYDEQIMNVSWCPTFDILVKKKIIESEKRPSKNPASKGRLETLRSQIDKETNVLEQSGIAKNLPEDSFDESIVQEDDMFDIYKDHEPDEFGHKKYQPEDILVKVEQERPQSTDYLAECLKLKEEILQRKNDPEPSIASLVEALDNTHVESEDSPEPLSEPPGAEATSSQSDREACARVESEDSREPPSYPPETEATTSQSDREPRARPAPLAVHLAAHPHKHLLATVGKYGGIRIWSKTGKLVGSCGTPGNPGGKNARDKVKAISWPTLLWYKPDLLFVADGKSQLLECNPLVVDCQNKMVWRVAHATHKRGLFAVTSAAPRVQPARGPAPDWPVWSAAQDRRLVLYSPARRTVLAAHHTCGGFVYDVQPCPYDANRFAICVGDGAVRVWEEAEGARSVRAYWHNVQGKVLVAAWHPEAENLLAYATAEARVGLLDMSGASGRVARALAPAPGAVYSLCWAEEGALLATGAGRLVRYDTRQTDRAPVALDVKLEGQCWEVCCVRHDPRGLLVGSRQGAVAVVRDLADLRVRAACFVFTKLIHSLAWHPAPRSRFGNVLAACALDKRANVELLQLVVRDDGSEELQRWKKLTGHRAPVFQLSWSPHDDELLLSTAKDHTARVWDVQAGACVSVLGADGAVLGGAWVGGEGGARALVGGSDCCVRSWAPRAHPPERYAEIHHETSKTQTKENCDKKKTKEVTGESDAQVATSCDAKVNVSKRFLLPITYKQINVLNKVPAIRKMIKMYLAKRSGPQLNGESASVEQNGDSTSVEQNEASAAVEKDGDSTNAEANRDPADASTAEHGEEGEEYDLDYLNMFGTTNQVNELLDKEMLEHEEGGRWEACSVLQMFRGHVTELVQQAARRDALCPFVLSLAPCVSHKYWKDVSQLYLAQIDRLVAKGEEDKLYERRHFGGAVYRRACMLLALNDARAAVGELCRAKLYKDAYVLCRVRHLDSVAEETLRSWVRELSATGVRGMAAVCLLVLGDVSRAATELAKCSEQRALAMAAELGALAGRDMFAEQVRQQAQRAEPDPSCELPALPALPSRAELLLAGANDGAE